MSQTRLFTLKAVLLSSLSASCAVAQIATPAQPTAPVVQAQAVPLLPKPLPNFYRNLIVIDPAHGGPDRGAQLPSGVDEKSVTLAFAQRLRPALVAQGFTVVGTRDSDPSVEIASDQRAGVANHTRPLACLLLHATESGTGVHLATSSLEPVQESSARAVRWEDAQAASVTLSLRLANEIGLALVNAQLPAVLLRASVPPVDNLTCAATVIEIAPSAAKGEKSSAVTDAAYQQRIAEAIAQGLANYRTHNAPAPAPSMGAPAAPARPAQDPAPAAKTAPVPPARPQSTPDQPAAQKGAPR